MDKERFGRFLNGDIAIRCKIIREAYAFLDSCKKYGVQPQPKEYDFASIWNINKSETAYACNPTGHEIYSKSRIAFLNEAKLVLDYEDVFSSNEMVYDECSYNLSQIIKFIEEQKLNKSDKILDSLGNHYTITEFFSDSMCSLMAHSPFIIKKNYVNFETARKSGKLIKVNDWRDFHTVKEALMIMSDIPKDRINECFEKDIWEIKEDE